MIRELGETIGDAVVESVGRAVGRSQEERPLPVDLLESDEAYLALFDAPGAEADDVQVRFEGGTVFVRVDRYREFHEGFEMRFPGRGLSLDGSVDLPEDAVIDPEGAEATLKENGTLEVRVPKADDDTGGAVEVTEESDTEESDADESHAGESDEPDGTDAAE